MYVERDFIWVNGRDKRAISNETAGICENVFKINSAGVFPRAIVWKKDQESVREFKILQFFWLPRKLPNFPVPRHRRKLHRQVFQ